MRNHGRIVFQIIYQLFKRENSMAYNTHALHDDAIKWKHFPRYWPFVRGIHRSPVNSPHKVQWRGALIFSLIRAWINGWVNNGEAGDLRRNRAHYDVTVMGAAKVEEMRPHGRQGLAKPVYNTHWWLPNAMSPVIGRHGIDLDAVEYFLLRWWL